MQRMWWPLIALGGINVGEYGTFALWGVVEPWRQTGDAVDPDAMLLCVTSLVALATVAMGFTISYSTLREELAPDVALGRGLMALALALPCLLCALSLALVMAPEVFFVLLFPLLPVSLTLPFLAVTALRRTPPAAPRALPTREAARRTFRA